MLVSKHKLCINILKMGYHFFGGIENHVLCPDPNIINKCMNLSLLGNKLWSKIFSSIFGSELSQVILCNEISTFAAYLCLRKGRRVNICFPFQHTVVLQMKFPVSFVLPKYLLTEIELKQTWEKVFGIFLVTVLSFQLSPRWTTTNIVHTQY